MKDISKLDLYGLFEIDINASEKEILRAYRKKALKCHPDKNKDNPKAVEQFHELSEALGVLTDKAARLAYDKVIRAKQHAAIRYRELDAKRRKLRDDLEAREIAAGAGVQRQLDARERLAREISRLRREGSTLLETEKNRMKEELNHDNIILRRLNKDTKHNVSGGKSEPVCIKVKWRSKFSEKKSMESSLESIFNRYGLISMVLVSDKKNNAVIEFENIFRSGVLEEDGDQVKLEVKLISGSIDIAKKPQDHSSVQSIIVRDVIDDDTTDNDNSSKWDRHKNKNDLSDEESDIEVLPDNHEDLELLIMKRMQEAHKKQQNKQ